MMVSTGSGNYATLVRTQTTALVTSTLAGQRTANERGFCGWRSLTLGDSPAVTFTPEAALPSSQQDVSAA
jgi:hypothetical protein